MHETIQDGAYVRIYLDARRTWLRKVQAGAAFHSNRGIIHYDDLIGRPYGIRIRSHSGQVFEVHRPTVTDIQVAMGRSTQIVYPKDAGMIIVETGIGAGSRVVESGTGSGALTWVLSNVVGDSGHVYTYEVREDMYRSAHKSLSRFADMDRITMYCKDVRDGIEERDVDAVVLDLATPWEVLKTAHEALCPSRVLASYSPTIEQVMRTCKALREDNRWGMIKTLEVLVREIMVREGKTRPPTWMVGHTGYMTFARKLVAEP